MLRRLDVACIGEDRNHKISNYHRGARQYKYVYVHNYTFVTVTYKVCSFVYVRVAPCGLCSNSRTQQDAQVAPVLKYFIPLGVSATPYC